MNTYIKYIFLSVYVVFSDEMYFEQSSGESANTELIQVYEYYRDNPLDLSSTSAIRLTSLPFININDANKFVRLRESLKTNDLKALLKVGDFDEKTNFIFSNCLSNLDKQKLSSDFRMRFLDRFQRVKGFRDSNFIGSPLDLFTRTRIGLDNYELNFTQNKNAGEKNIFEENRFALAYLNNESKLVIGDIKIKRGLGLALSNGFAVRKDPQATNGFNIYGEGILPSRSVYEFSRFRGIAAQQKFYNKNVIIEPMFYYFNTNRPANSIDSNEVSSLNLTGLYRTENEIDKKDLINEVIIGGGLEISYLNLFSLGFNNYQFNYNKLINSDSKRYFNKQKGLISSIYGFIDKQEFNFSFELAKDAEAKLASTNNLTILKSNHEFLISFRYLEPNLRMQYSNIITESSVKSNEQGFYLGIESKYNKYKNNIYLDIFQSVKPIDDFFLKTGFEILDDFIYKIPKGNINFRFRHESKSFLDNINRFINRSRTSARLEINKKLSKTLESRIRVEYATINFQGDYRSEDGILSFVEFKKQLFKNFKFGSRFTFYNTKSFESAIWHFEYLVPGYAISPALYGQGNKLLAFAKYELNRFDIWLRYTRDKRFSQSTISSSNEQINGNIDERLYLQIDWRI
ncbi:hypothetical protein OAQ99_06620 [Candidatus Kapabacteria bacterium]|nr:hypothetical protein [Candidatus Kapabacteria bacterium]